MTIYVKRAVEFTPASIYNSGTYHLRMQRGGLGCFKISLNTDHETRFGPLAGLKLLPKIRIENTAKSMYSDGPHQRLDLNEFCETLRRIVLPRLNSGGFSGWQIHSMQNFAFNRVSEAVDKCSPSRRAKSMKSLPTIMPRV